jgi:hypothetical protein
VLPSDEGDEAARPISNAAIHNHAEADRHKRWARDLHASLTPSVTGGAYVNFLGNEGQERVKATMARRQPKVTTERVGDQRGMEARTGTW